MAKRKTMYRSAKQSENGEWFALKQTTKGAAINFWHITPEHTYLYTFKRNDEYNEKMAWTDDVCRELVREMRKSKPSVDVIRFAVDGVYYLNVDGAASDGVPKVPCKPDGANEDQEKAAQWKHRLEIEKKKCSVPAPYILYGKHDGMDKEYAWRLTPDKPKRKGIRPGDRVVVWTRKGFREATVTRIEEARDKVQPAARVKKKLSPGPKAK